MSSLRSVLALLLGILGCLLVVVSLLAVWVKVEMLDTDRYVAAVTPLAENTAVQDQVVDEVTAALLDSTDASDLPAVLEAPVADAVRDQTRKAVRSNAFDDLWVETNRDLHRQALAALTSDDTTTRASDGQLTLNLTPVVDVVRTEVLADVPGLDALPDTDEMLPRIPLRLKVADADDVHRGRGVARAVEAWAYWTAAITVLALVLSVLLARRRARTTAWLGVGLVVAGAVTLGLRQGGAAAVRGRVPDGVAGDGAVDAVYGALTTTLREGSWAVLVVGAMLAVGFAVVARARVGR